MSAKQWCPALWIYLPTKSKPILHIIIMSSFGILIPRIETDAWMNASTRVLHTHIQRMVGNNYYYFLVNGYSQHFVYPQELFIQTLVTVDPQLSMPLGIDTGF